MHKKINLCKHKSPETPLSCLDMRLFRELGDVTLFFCQSSRRTVFNKIVE